MAELINFNKAKKAKAKTGDTSRAAENRLRFGLTKVQKIVDRLDALRAQRELDGKKRDK